MHYLCVINTKSSRFVVEICVKKNLLGAKNLLVCCLINLTLQSLLLLACCFKLLHMQQDKCQPLSYC